MFSQVACTLSLLTLAPIVLAQSSASVAASPSGATALTFTPASQNPSAVPLSSIVATAASAATTTVTDVRSTNTVISGAPSMPVASSLVPSNYPALDKLPPTDSAEVKQWIQEVQNSGITIPGWTPNTSGVCSENSAAASDPSRCWWTCTGCVRNTDITNCTDKNTWGLTYDDGPSPYTPDLLNFLDEKKITGTFFVVGSRVISYPALAQQEYLAGHHISVHTWSHPYLTTLTNEQIIAELGWTRKVIKDTLGVTPNTMRPPYGDIDDRVRAISMALGLTPIMWTRINATSTFDTGDFDVHGGLTTSQQVLNNWNGILASASQLNTGFIVLEHDLFQQTVELATGYILPDAVARGIKIEPVITCVNKDLSAAYVETNKTSSSSGSGNGSSGGNSSSGGSSNNGAFKPSSGLFGIAVVLSMVGAGLVL